MITGTYADGGDLLLVCRLSDVSCEVAVEGPHSFILPGRSFYE